MIVVGNLSVGGTGKTPLCGYLVQQFKAMGWRPAIVSRGYGGQRFEQPHRLVQGDTANVVGDEPLMLFEQTGVPVCVCVNRAAAVQALSSSTNANLIISDDGLQHYAMPRVTEIVVIDAARGLGNRWVLPAGPLRESVKRLNNVDLIVLQRAKATAVHPSLSTASVASAVLSQQNQSFYLKPTEACDLVTGHCVELASFTHQHVHAVAGIGHPQRFFDALQNLGLTVIGHAFSDHHVFVSDDLAFDDSAPVLVTSKDAVKLRALVNQPAHVFEVCTRVDASDELQAAIVSLEKKLSSSIDARTT